MNDKTQTIILAAGKGTRMGGDIPKVLKTVGERTMIDYVCTAVAGTGETDPVLVIGFMADMVKEACVSEPRYVEQVEQKGTGHAVLVAQEAIDDDTKAMNIVFGDQPFVTTETLNNLSDLVCKEEAKIAIVTSIIDSDDLFENQFAQLGRIIRNEEGEITAIIEAKDATEEQLAVREMNIGFLSLEKDWAQEHLPLIDNNNVKGEFYLTTLVKMAFEQGTTVHSLQIPVKEAMAANTLEQLAVLEEHA